MYDLFKKCTTCHSPIYIDNNMHPNIPIWKTCHCFNSENLNQTSEYMLVLVVMLYRKEQERLAVGS